MRKLLRDQCGGAAVEFALVAPLIMLVLGAIGLFCMELDSHNKARDAVKAGAHYVMQGGSSPAAIRDVALASWRGPQGALSVQVDQYCACGSQVLTCPGMCQSDPAPRFTRIRGSASIVQSESRPAKLFVAEQVVRTR